MRRVMVRGRNDNVIANALEAMVQAMENQHRQQNQNGGNDDGARAWGRFQRNNPPIYKGRHDINGAQAWLKSIEKIFRVVICMEDQKMQFSTHMLEEEDEDWWKNARQRIEILGVEITWAVFRDAFLDKYFL